MLVCDWVGLGNAVWEVTLELNGLDLETPGAAGAKNQGRNKKEASVAGAS